MSSVHLDALALSSNHPPMDDGSAAIRAIVNPPWCLPGVLDRGASPPTAEQLHNADLCAPCRGNARPQRRAETARARPGGPIMADERFVTAIVTPAEARTALESGEWFETDTAVMLATHYFQENQISPMSNHLKNLQNTGMLCVLPLTPPRRSPRY